MHKAKPLLLFSLLSLFFFSAYGQDFSNKGKDFWVGYGYHVRYVTGGPTNGQEMVLYFATEAVTNVKVEIPALGYVQNYSIPANTIFTSNPLPKSGAQDARLTSEGVVNKGIHITSDQPIVAYAHIYNGNVSGATLLFPTNTLGREYYSINYDQKSNEGSSNCFFYVVAADTGTTTVEIIPSASTQTMLAGQSYTITLTQGQIFNAMGTLSGNNGVDLTGSKIRSISSGTAGCKRIAVFSGSGKFYINCAAGQPSSADNYMVQAFPKDAWGKSYLTAPTQNFQNNFYRIAVLDPTTVVRMNGTVLTGLVGNFYYQVGPTNTPNLIEADKPIMVAQYITTQGACNNGPVGDPEVIYLSPVEQTINKVILNSTPNSAITQHFVNVIIPTGGTAISSFRIDGVTPGGSFTVHPFNSNYAYLQLQVGAGQHTLQSDSGFNAIAYGYGNAESYGYNAGANVKDLYQYVSVQNQYATVNFPAVCQGSPFFFSTVFPYQPTQIKWIFGGLFPDVTLNNPVFDSTWQVNGRTLYRYKIPAPYTINTPGSYPIKIAAQNPTADGCSGEQEVLYDLQVFNKPQAAFSFTNNGCVSDSVRFTDNSNSGGRNIIKWSWDFGDNSTGSIKNPSHLYTAAGSYPVKLSIITDIGCLSDTVTNTVALTSPPVARFGVSSPLCAGSSVTFSDSSTIVSGTLTKWTWNFSNGNPPVIATTNAAQTTTYATAATYPVSLVVETATGCTSLPAIRQVTINPKPVPDFTFGNACLPSGTMQFTNTTTISDGTQGLLQYVWNFGGTASSTQANPTYSFTAIGPVNVGLAVTSNAGCKDSITKAVNTIYAQPQGLFNAPAQICLGQSINLRDSSIAPASTITQWQWNFGDGNTSAQQNPTHTYTAAGTYYITLTATSAIGCVSTIGRDTIVVNALPVASFAVSNPLCETRVITFTNTSTAASGVINKWTWNLDNGTGAFVVTSGAAQTATYASAGIFNASLQVETDRGCVSTVTQLPFTINPLPKPGFIMPDNCLTDPFSQFTDTSKIADGSEASFTYQWNFGDPNATVANPNTSTVKNAQHRFVQTGNYNVQLRVTSNRGCIDSVTQVFTMNGTQPLSVFTINGGGQVCSNQTVSVTNNSTVDIGNVVKLEIFWDFANDLTNKTTVVRPAVGAVFTHTYPEFFTPFTQTKQVRVVAYSGDACFNQTTQTLTLLATPQIQFDTIMPVCADVPAFTLSQATVVNALPGAGVYSGRGVSGGVFNPAAAGIGRHLIRYNYTGTNGCTNAAEMTAIVFPVPVVNAGVDRFVLEGGSVQLLGTATGTGLSYLWTPNRALNNATIAQPSASPTDDITYTLKVTSADGCSGSDDVFVKVLKTPVIPNVFTPNGDGYNDKWEIKYLESYPGATIEIFNRYGQKVFESVGYGRPWDGNYKGSPLPSGTYYYIINPKNGRKQLAGFVDILR